MADSSLAELRGDAKRAGVEWSEVASLAAELRQLDLEQREHTDGARKYAWELYLYYGGWSDARRPFWRCGFDALRVFLDNNDRDFASLKAYDCIAVSVAVEYPHWEDRCDDLWDFLLNELYQPRPTWADLCEQALAMATAPVSLPASGPEELPY